jgi:hypothetical protein
MNQIECTTHPERAAGFISIQIEFAGRKRGKGGDFFLRKLGNQINILREARQAVNRTCH